MNYGIILLEYPVVGQLASLVSQLLLHAPGYVGTLDVPVEGDGQFAWVVGVVSIGGRNACGPDSHWVSINDYEPEVKRTN